MCAVVTVYETRFFTITGTSYVLFSDRLNGISHHVVHSFIYSSDAVPTCDGGHASIYYVVLNTCNQIFYLYCPVVLDIFFLILIFFIVCVLLFDLIFPVFAKYSRKIPNIFLSDF